MAKEKVSKNEVLPDSEGDFLKNYADDADVARRFIDMGRDILIQTRTNRRSLEELWLADLRAWSCMLDDQGYTGRSLIFVPELNTQVESSVERALTALFPTDEPFVGVALRPIDEENAKKITAAVRYELEEKARLMINYDRHIRNKTLFGTAVLKQTYEKKMQTIWTRDKRGRAVKSEIAKYMGVKVRPVDIFRWYVFPEVCPDLVDSEMQFEDCVMSRDFLESVPGLANLGDVSEVATGQADIDHEWVDVERLELVRLSNALTRYRKSCLITEIWTEFALKKGGPKVPVRAWMANGTTLILLKKNPFWHQESPYLGSRYINRPGGIFYGLSLPDKIRSQQYQMNDLANQTMDSITYALNPIAIIDPALAGDVQSMKLQPGARWLGSPEGIKFESFPDVSPSGLRAMAEVRGQIAQFSDNSPGIAPQLQGKARSATQASIVQASVGARSRLQSMIETSDVLGPLCKRTHILMQQFMKDDEIIRIQGPDMGEWTTMKIKPEDLVGDLDFIWKGVAEQEKTAVYSQQLLAFFQSALQVSQLMPGEVDLPLLFRRVAKEAFNLRELDDVFKSLKDKKTVDPTVENEALKQEMDIDIHNGDDDEEHIAIHSPLGEQKELSDEAHLQIGRHIEKHRVQMQAKKDLLQQKAKLQALQSANAMGGPAGAGGPGAPGGGAPQSGGAGSQGPQPPPSPMEGNQGQVPTSLAGAFKGVQS